MTLTLIIMCKDTKIFGIFPYLCTKTFLQTMNLSAFSGRAAGVALLISSFAASNAAVHRQSLPIDWQFRQERKVAWHPATVPGTVHTDLMAIGLIPDPFVGENERMVQWVDKEDWIYETRFDADSITRECGRVDLVFEGLDTYADVFLNDSLILKADNMFRTWEIPVEGLLRPQGNELKVYFHSPIKVDMPKFDALPFQYDAGNDQAQNGGLIDKRVSVFARKAGYHYGWDWGPRLVTSGIWRPVYLRGYDDARIDNVFFRTGSISRKQAEMSATIEVESERSGARAQLTVSDAATGKRLASGKLTLNEGVNRVPLPMQVKNPRLWWSRGLGDANLYDFKVELTVDGKVVDTRTERTGIRTVEVVREEDAGGRSFYFKLNGVPVFAKGANYIPCDNFLPRVTPEIYRRTVQDAADANMNMLRIWGGGIYEDDRFYELCDSLGIMVWQDFMFACSLYPTEGELLDNIRREAEDNVRRLRNHPSIAIWCGNNECLEAWYNWGLKRRYEKQGVADTIWRQYEALYHEVLPEVMAEHAPDMYYHPSSPFSRKEGSPEPDRGDYHLWLVWGGGQPIDTYNHFRSRFFSEYGFQSFPELETVKKYAPDPAEHYIDSDVMLAHQRAGAGANRKIERYLLDSYREPKDFASLLYMTQVLQGDAIKTAIEAHRSDRPYCMGSLFWQHNDCWPVASWSSRDFFGRWKAQHYFAKKAYRDILVTLREDGDSLTATVVSDLTEPVKGTLRLRSAALDGTPGQHEITRELTVGETARVKVAKEALYAPADSANTFVLATFNDDYENIFLPAAPKAMKFTEPNIEITIGEANAEGEYPVTVKADRFVRAMRLTLDGDDSHFFSDNYFDLLPGREATVSLRTSLPREQINIVYTHLFDAQK